MDLGLKGRVAIIAASSSGLGKAVALGLATEGARLAICSRSEARINAAAEEIRRNTGGEVLAQAVDVAKYDQVQAFVRNTVERYGRLDICVANAGGPPAKPFAEISLEEWQTALNLNFMSTVYFAREVLPLMQKQKWGRLIAITSASAKQPMDGLILSNALRAGVTGLLKSLANEYAKYNVLVNNVCPGSTSTARLDEISRAVASREGVAPEVIRDRWASQIPLGRLGTAEEFANLVVFLTSERATFIAGVSIPVDGGFVKATY
jgi:3-oxoacyl-[acyl-carrier protein] reductase